MNTNKSSNNPYEEKFQKNKRLKILFLVTTIIVTLIALAFAVLLVLSLTGILNIPALQIGSRSSSMTGKAFETPEEVIDQFVMAIQSNDFESALELFAVDNIIENYDFEAYNERINAFVPINSMMPQNYESYFVINRAYRLNSAAIQIKIFTYSFLIPDIDLIRTIPLNEIEDKNIDLVHELDPSELDSLGVVRIDRSNPELQREDRYQEIRDRERDMYGFLDQEEYLVLYEFKGDNYVGGVTLVEYEEGWQLMSLNSNLAGIYYYDIGQITESEYLELIGD